MRWRWSGPTSPTPSAPSRSRSEGRLTHSLPIFVRLQGRPVILIGDGPAAEAKRRLLERAGAHIVGEGDAAALAIVAAEDDAAVARLQARGVLVNAVDRPAICDFTLPAIVDRDPVLVAIGTGGVSAGLAAALRQRLEALLPSGLGRVADALYAARGRLRRRFPDAGDRRRAIAGLLAAGGPLDSFAEHADPAVAIEAAEPKDDRIESVALASADPDLLTLRTARLLALADRIYYPHGMAAAILDRARADAERIEGAPPAVPPPGLSVHLTWDRT